MKDFFLNNLVRKNIQDLQPYSSARSEYTAAADVFLDANESAYPLPLADDYTRYPDPLQWKLKDELSKIKGIPPHNIFIGNGSDEIIDLAFRIFCEPAKDNVIICPPTYGMYKVYANINNIFIRTIDLTTSFQLDVERILEAVTPHTKMIFICSPNNPTGNNLNRIDIELLLNNFNGIILIDEAYINFSRQKSFLRELTEYENLIVMQTLSKAWGLAALRLGLGFASQNIIYLFNKVKPPYNINKASQQFGLQALSHIDEVNKNIKNTIEQRDFVSGQLHQFDFIKNVFQSDANFILIKTDDADTLYNYLSGKKIIVRNRSREPLCEGCLRVTIGTKEENNILLDALKNYTNA